MTMTRIPTLLFAACTLAGAGFFAMPVLAQDAAVPTKKAATAAKKQPAKAATAGEDPSLSLFRHDLVNLLALSGDPHKQLAAAQIAAPDGNDPKRSVAKKTPYLIKHALELGPQDALVNWVAAANPCQTEPGCAEPTSITTLQTIDADNAAVWLLSFPADSDAEKSRASVARMAQASHYNEYWDEDVVVLYHALEILPVPKEILSLGISQESARINFATSIASSTLPVALQHLHKFCTTLDASKDAASVSDCIAVARKLESGTFVAQGIGFAIEEALLSPGVDKDVMATRRRSAAYQKERFMALSGRFSREPALAQAYVATLEKATDEHAAVIAFLRGQNEHTDPPDGWQPAQPAKPAGDADPFGGKSSPAPQQ
jgi:hypothetical protein